MEFTPCDRDTAFLGNEHTQHVKVSYVDGRELDRYGGADSTLAYDNIVAVLPCGCIVARAAMSIKIYDSLETRAAWLQCVLWWAAGVT